MIVKDDVLVVVRTVGRLADARVSRLFTDVDSDDRVDVEPGQLLSLDDRHAHLSNTPVLLTCVLMTHRPQRMSRFSGVTTCSQYTQYEQFEYGVANWGFKQQFSEFFVHNCVQFPSIACRTYKHFTCLYYICMEYNMLHIFDFIVSRGVKSLLCAVI